MNEELELLQEVGDDLRRLSNRLGQGTQTKIDVQLIMAKVAKVVDALPNRDVYDEEG